MVKFKTRKNTTFAIPGHLTFVFIAVIVFFISIAFTLYAWHQDQEWYNREKVFVVNNEVEGIKDSIKFHQDLYLEVLINTAAYTSHEPDLKSSSWNDFIDSLSLSARYPGILNIGYAQYVKSADKQQFISLWQAENDSSYSIYPTSEQPAYTPIKFISEINNRTSLSKIIGYDLLSDSKHSAAITTAINTGRPSSVHQTQLINTNNQSGYIIYLPVYAKNDLHPTSSVSDRQKNITGLVFGYFDYKSCFEQIARQNKNLPFRVYLNNSVDKAIFQSDNYHTDQVKNLQYTTINIVGSSLIFAFNKDAAVSQNLTSSSRPLNILISGLLFSVAVAVFVYLLVTSRAKSIMRIEQIEAQQAKDELLSLASHQLRTPATSVKQYIGLLLEGYLGKLTNKQLAALNKAYSSNERQLETINQILYVSKADAGQLKLQISRFDLNKLIDSVVNDMQKIIREHHQTVKVIKKHEPLLLSADSNCIRMIIENLLSNAVKYTHQRGNITITSGMTAKAIYFAVADSGVGIKVRDFNKLFKKFSRIDNELSIQAGGSGIGLYLDKILVELHNGHIEVNSESRKGTTFKVVLPSINKPVNR